MSTKPELKYYCAGPIDQSPDRLRWGRFDWNLEDDLGLGFDAETKVNNWKTTPGALREIPEEGLAAGYAGPYVGGSNDHGLVHAYPHGLMPALEASWFEDAKPEWGADTVIRDLKGIDTADVVVGWIPREGCHGTIAEIGYAVAKGKKIVLGFSHQALMASHWFLAFMVINGHEGDYSPVVVVDSPALLLAYVDRAEAGYSKNNDYARFASIFTGETVVADRNDFNAPFPGDETVKPKKRRKARGSK